MADVFCIVNQTVKLSEPTRKFQLPQPLVYQNQLAHKFAATIVNDDCTPAILSDVTVTATMLLANNTTVEDIDGFVDGNVAYALLPPVCYGVAGRFKFNLNLSSNGSTRTILWVDGYVEKTTSNQVTFPEVDEDNLPVVIGEAKSAATLATNAATAANTAAANANTATANAERVNIAQSKTGNVITVTTTNRNGVNTAKTITEPTATVSKDQDGPYHITVNDANGTTQAEIPDPAAEVKTKANRSSVSTVKHAIGADGQLTLTDALNEPAKKMTIHLEPKQDLHGYDKPWVGGAGKNLCASSVKSETAFGLTLVLADDGTFKVTGTYDRTQATTFYDADKAFALQAGTYVLSGTPNNDLGAKLIVVNTGTNSNVVTTDTSFTLNESATVRVAMTVPASANGKSLPSAGVVFKPMIRTATVTDPTYEPYSNICPIEGYDSVEITSTGKNLLNVSKNEWDTAINGEGKPTALNGWAYSELIPVRHGCTYTFSFINTMAETNTWIRRIHGYDKNGNWLRQIGYINVTPNANERYAVSVTVPSDVDCVRISYHSAGSVNAQFELGSIATEYEQYSGNIVSLNLVSSAGSTVYGGTVTVNEDGSGTLVVDKGRVTIDNFLNLSSAVQVSGLHWADTTQNVFDINVDGESICSMLADRKDGNAGWGSTTDCFALGTPGLRIYTSETTNAAFREKYKDVQITYTFNTPLEYQLTAAQLHTLVGTNHIWTDGTNLELDYRTEKYADTDKLYAAFPKDTVTGNPATFTDGADGIPVESLTVNIEPKQDLHGYDHPWVGGAGKNLLHSFTNKSFSVTGITISTLDDGSLWTAGKATDVVEASFIRVPRDTNKTYYINGCPSGGSTSTYRIIVRLFEGNLMVGTLSDIGNGLVLPPTEQPTATEMRIGIWFNNGYTTTGMNFKPMVIVGSSAEPYEPHENICPIAGWDTIRLGENLYHKGNVLLGKNWINQSAPNRAYIFFDIEKGARYTYHMVYHGNNNLGVVYGENSATGQAQTFSWNSGMAVSTLNEHTVTNTNAFLQFQWNDGGRTDPIQWSDINDWEIVISKTSENATAQTIPVKSISGSTVYGGKLTIKEDGSGELTSEWFYGVLPVCSNVGSSIIAGSSGKYGIFNVASLPQLDTAQNTVNVVFDSMGSTTLVNRGAAWRGYVNDEDNIGCFLPSDYTAEDATAALTGTHFAARLKSPTTYPLSAHEVTTLLGTNHITCDAGQVTVTYNADVTKYIEKKVTMIASSILGS